MTTMTNVMSCDTAIPTERTRAIKVRQQAMWASGDFSVIGATLQIVGELLNEAADVRARHKVLDVAAGSGNATLAAARRFASVTSTDYVPALLERGRRRADAEGFTGITFEVADAEVLPYPDASFHVVLSTFGVMFAPDHQRAAAELTRVCMPGGRIGLANWTPTGFLGQLLRLIAQYVPPAPGAQSPLLWGTEAHVRELFAGAESTTRLGCSRFDMSRRSTGWTCSGASTAPPTPPFWHSMRMAGRLWRPTSSLCFGRAMWAVQTDSSSQASIWRLSSRNEREIAMSAKRRLMAVLAHPDDESLGVGGTLAKYASEGVDVCLVTATRGDGGRFRGYPRGEDGHPGRAAVASTREAELRAAATVLGIREVSVLDYRDQAARSRRSARGGRADRHAM